MKNEFYLSAEALAAFLESAAQKGIALRFRARGFSMSPFVRDGDILTVSAMTDRDPRKGDVLAFLCPRNGKLAIHRVVERAGNRYLMKGDSSYTADGLVAKEYVLGRVTRVERNGRDVLLGLGRERVLVAFLSLNTALFPFLCAVRGGIKRLLKGKHGKQLYGENPSA